jgi:hypothetical protein
VGLAVAVLVEVTVCVGVAVGVPVLVKEGVVVAVGLSVAVAVPVTVAVGVVVAVAVGVTVAVLVTVKEGVATGVSVAGITGWNREAGTEVAVGVTVLVAVTVGEAVGVGESMLVAVAVSAGGAGVALGGVSGWRWMSSTWGTEETIRVVLANVRAWACWAPATFTGGGRARGPLAPAMAIWLRMIPSTGSTIRIFAGWSVTTINLPSSVTARERGCAGKE